MKNKIYPVKYAKKSSISPFLKAHIESFPNAGPHPNITGMRRVWGEFNQRKLFLVMMGSYVYNVNWDTYSQV